MEQYELPDGWAWARLGDVCEPVEQVDPGRTPDRNIRYIDISSIDSERNEIIGHKEFLGSEAPSRARKPICAGDILFATVRTYLRNVAMVPPAYDGEIASTGFCVLRTCDGIDSRLIFRYLLTDEFIKRISEKQRGISYPAVTDRDVYAESVPLPPLAEQRRIVVKIEALFQQSRTVRQALDRIPPLIKQFRQAVLAAAFRGELTGHDSGDEPASILLERIRAERRRKWEEILRAQGKDPHRYTYEEPAPPDTSDLPEGWVWTSLESITQQSQNGFSKRSSQTGKPTPVLRLADISQNRIHSSDLRLIGMSDEEREKYLLNRGDLLIIRVNGSKELVGQAVLFDEEGDYAFCDHFIRYSLFSQFVSPKYVSLYFRDRITRNHIAFNMVSTAGQNTISQSSLATLPITLPPLAEQHRVVARVQALFAQADAVEAAVEAARRRLDKLDQAILARAFRGELVPQDPDDEPASVLVERIRQERAAGAAQKTHPRGNKRRRGTRGVEDRLIREWAAAYRLWNEGELARRLTVAGRESMQEKLAAFFDLCETMFQIAPSKSTGLYQAQLRAHIAERERMQRFEEGRAHAESDT